MKNSIAERIADFLKNHPPFCSLSLADLIAISKESQVLQVAKSSNLISPNLHKIMKEKLDRRNIAAHPSGVEISQLTAEEFIRDLVVNVVLAL